MRWSVIGLLLTAITVKPAMAQVLVPDALSCPRCTLTTSTLTTLGATDGPGSLTGMPISVGVDALGRYWVSDPSEPPLIFDKEGNFVAMIGRRGQGPGEFAGPSDFVLLSGDSSLVIDRVLSRGTVVGPDLQVHRSIALPGQAISGIAVGWPKRLVINSILSAADRIGWPLHALLLDGTDVTVVESFGTNQGELRAGGLTRLITPITSASGSQIWSAERQRYLLALWSETGELVQSIERRPSWFPVGSAGGIGTPTTPPSPYIKSIATDDEGLLWVYSSVPAREWKEAWPSGLPPGVSEVSTRQIDSQRLYDTTLEIIDPATGRVVHRQTLGKGFVAALPGRRAAFYREAQDGVPTVDIVALSLSGRR